MNDETLSFEALINEARQAHFSGWDFSWLAGRVDYTETPWDYRQLVIEYISRSEAMLDMETGGGEFLAELPQRPLTTCATEDYEPNIPIAKARLGSLGIEVYQSKDDGKELPFSDNSFDLVINRHGSFYAPELFRVLRPGGIFLSQQVGPANEIQLNEFLAPDIAPTYSGEEFSLAQYLKDFQLAGFEVIRAESAGTPAHYYDIGAVVYYLKAIPWQIPGFVCEENLAVMRKLHEKILKEGKFTTMEDRMLLILQKPTI
ncbi:MAG: class I SAM-dependent methyltransferase [Anaerolineae bacterium]|jgi:SAM-dependent methyltransferase|nr:class I SAM-dependent methyltransferase [Anaerolineae bacterium]